MTSLPNLRSRRRRCINSVHSSSRWRAGANAFGEAVERLGRRLGRPTAGLPAPDFSEPAFSNALFIQLAALTALDDASPAREPGTLVAASLLTATLEREAKHWRGAGLAATDDAVRRRAVAVATLTTVADEAEAAAALAVVPDLAGDANQGTRRRVARWLHDLYPGESWLNPLEPDLLGEALVAGVLDELPRLAAELVALSTDDQTHRILTVLTRAAHDHSSAERALSLALAEHLPSLWRAALNVGKATGDPMGRLLADSIDHYAPPGLADEIAPQIPSGSIALDQVAVITESKALEELAAEPVPRKGDDLRAWKVDYARRLGAISQRFSTVGLTGHAIAASQEAVSLFRDLAARDPDGEDDTALQLRSPVSASTSCTPTSRRRQSLHSRRRFTSWASCQTRRPRIQLLATVLTAIAASLRELHRNEPSLRAAQGAVDVARDLAAADPDEGRVKLVNALIELSASLGQSDRFEDGLAAAEEAAALLDDLPSEKRDALQSSIASAAQDRALHLAQLGRHEESLVVREHAVAMLRELAGVRPGFERPWATALTRLALATAEAGNNERALAQSHEAVELLRHLAVPGRDVDFARALKVHSACLARAGQPEDALAAIREAIASYCPYDPATPMGFFEVQDAVSDLSNRLHDVGLVAEADEATMNPFRFMAQPDARLGFVDVPGEQRRARAWVDTGGWVDRPPVPQDEDRRPL